VKNLLDKEEFCSLIKLYEKSMYNLACSMARNEHDAADIMSESVLRAYSNIDKLKNKDAFRAWILRIVHNTAAEYIRKNCRIVYLDEVNEEKENIREFDLSTELTLRKAVDSLSQKYREAVVLFYYEDFTTKEIATIIGKSEPAVRQLLARGRKQLKEISKEDFYNG
jgi:RNA polymerase sigma-70 factor (ECF subfamily)